MTDKEKDLIQKLAVDSALAGVAEGKRLERERIIKLLEQSQCKCGSACGIIEVTPLVLALIKEETK